MYEVFQLVGAVQVAVSSSTCEDGKEGERRVRAGKEFDTWELI